MRKIISLISLLLLALGAWSADVFQLENSDFEEWSSAYEPVMWHTYASAGGGLGSMVQSKNQSSKITDDLHKGTQGTTAVKVNARSVLGISANGMLTTGQIEGNSATPTDSKNHNISKDGYRSPFTGRPDSVAAWLKTLPKATTQKARFFFLFHNNSNTQDPGTTWTQVVAIAGTNVPYQSDWQRVAIPVYYQKLNESLVIDGWNGKNIISETKTPACTEERPSYCLASIATNFQAGQGSSSDALYVDDLVMIYNSKLASLTINGSSIAGFSKDKFNYTVNSSYSSSTVAYKSDGKFATTAESFDKATNVLTITVKGDDYTATGNSHTYTIQFASECNPVLTDLTINGKTISGFSSNTFNYSVNDVYANVTVNATANACATSTSSWNEATQTYTIKVSSNGSTNTYNIQFHAAYGSQLTVLKIDGTDVKGFSPSVYNYTVDNAYREAGLYYVADPDATVEKAFDTKTNVLTLTVKGGDFATNSGNTHTYTIQYHEPYESLLTDLKFYGKAVSGFSPSTTSYNVSFAYTSSNDITYTASEGASVTPSFNSSTNVLTLTVSGFDIAANPANKHIYTIQCHAPYNSQLSALSVNGSSVKNFNADKYNYTTDASYVEGQTKIAYTAAKDAQATGVYNAKTNSYIVTVEGGDIAWNPANKHAYTISFHDAYGSKLTDISINGVTIEGFDPNVFEYQLSSTYNSAIVATPDDEAEITTSYDPASYTMTYTVSGADIASNPSNTHTYTVRFHAPYGSYLKSLAINGKTLAEFTKTKTSYEVAETYTNGCVTFEADDEATTTTSYDSGKGIFTIIVKGGDIATNATNTHTYRITFVGSYGSQLTSLKVNGVNVNGFSADTYNYSLMSAYNEGQTSISYTTDDGATATGSFNTQTNIYTIVVSGADSKTNPSNKHTYTIAFHDSYGSQLTSLTIGGVSVKGFAPDVYQYTVANAYDPSLLSYTQDDDATVDKTEDAKNYVVTLKVKGGDYLDNSGNTHTYTIQFHAPYASQLTSLSNNGQAVTGFNPNVYKYTLNSTYENSQISFTISAEASSESHFDEAKNQLSITVKGGDFSNNPENLHIYVIEFHDSYGSNLTSLKVDRVQIDGFEPNQYNYLVESLYDSNVTCETDADASYTMSFDESTHILTIVVSGGDISSNPTNQHTYTVQFEAPSVLTSLKVDGTSVPNFRDSKYSYSMTSAVYENVKVSYTASEGATVETSYNEETGLFSLVVKGMDIKTFPSNTHTYTIQFHTSYSSYLTDLLVNGKTMEGFDRKKLEYLVKAPYRECQITYTPDVDARAKMNFNDETQILTIQVTGGDYSENPSNTHTYSIQFYAPSQLTNVKVNGSNLSGFSANTYEYDLRPNAYQDVKFVSYCDDGARTGLSYDNSTDKLTVSVYGADFDKFGDNKHVYQFQFSAPYESTLSSLKVDGKELIQGEEKQFTIDAFYKDVDIKATATDERANIIQTYDESTYLLTLRVEGGNINRVAGNYTVYTIQFNDPTNYGSQLQTLKVNGELLSDFAPDNYQYYLDGSYSNLKITYLADEKATVEESFDYDNNSLVLTVKGGNYAKDPTNIHTYAVKFTAQFSYGSQITNLYVDGGKDQQFDKDNYEYTIPAGYKASEIGITVNSLAQYCEYYDDEKQTLTVVVWGGDYATNSGNFHTYIFRFSK